MQSLHVPTDKPLLSAPFPPLIYPTCPFLICSPVRFSIRIPFLFFCLSFVLRLDAAGHLRLTDFGLAKSGVTGAA